MKLGERLAAIASLVPRGAKLADIGTDHAYLPISLLQAGKIAYAVAGEVNKGPYAAAQAMIKQYNLQHQIQLRLGNGLAVLHPGEVDTVVIAGMGAATIIAILSQHPATSKSLRHLILQPMTGGAALRFWLRANGWRIDEEELAMEQGHIYEIIAAAQGPEQDWEPILAEIGPVLWAKRHPLLKEHIKRLIEQTRRVIAQMSVSPAARGSQQYQDYQVKLEQLEEKYQCL